MIELRAWFGEAPHPSFSPSPTIPPILPTPGVQMDHVLHGRITNFLENDLNNLKVRGCSRAARVARGLQGQCAGCKRQACWLQGWFGGCGGGSRAADGPRAGCKGLRAGGVHGVVRRGAGRGGAQAGRADTRRGGLGQPTLATRRARVGPTGDATDCRGARRDGQQSRATRRAAGAHDATGCRGARRGAEQGVRRAARCRAGQGVCRAPQRGARQGVRAAARRGAGQGVRGGARLGAEHGVRGAEHGVRGAEHGVRGAA
ncbi:unnamed protein product [Closterium sp. NIES-64]|nr:unnamed protein product [Closterium sp. NIES-64]